MNEWNVIGGGLLIAFGGAAMHFGIVHARHGRNYLSEKLFAPLTDEQGFTGHWDWSPGHGFSMHYVPDQPGTPNPPSRGRTLRLDHPHGGFVKIVFKEPVPGKSAGPQ